MPVNKSLNKVRVTRLLGTDDTAGEIDPFINMQVTRGIDPRWIVHLASGNYTVGLALHSGGPNIATEYPHALVCSTGVAGYFGWPTGNGDTTFGHKNTYPNGVPHASGNNLVYEQENLGPTTVYRDFMTNNN